MNTIINVDNFYNYLKQYKDNKSVLSEYFFNSNYDKNKSKISNLYESYLSKKYKDNFLSSNYYTYIDILNEGLVITQSYDKFIEKLSTLNLRDYDAYIIDTDNNYITKMIDCIFIYDEYLEKENEIKQYINNMGYFISNSYIDTVLSEYGQIIHIQVEPKFIIEATDEIYKLNYLYHITLGVKYDKIKNKGLIPKSYCKKVYHPDRIYFYYKELDDFNFINQAKSLYKNNNEYIDNVKKFIEDKGLEIVILKIDLSKFNKLQYRFFYDPNQMLSVFTYEVIHPDCVSFYKSFYI